MHIRMAYIKKDVILMSQNKEISRDGSFKRQRTLFTTPFGNRQGDLPVEKNRYRLIWAAPCPWSHRAVIVRKLLGLEEAISLGEVAPIRPDVPRIDWDFSLEDRKSTRLNSSHVASSYAVFCL